MARSNPNKKKRRAAKATAQIVVEGHTEEAFCKYLKSIYAPDCGVRVEIHNARGGSPKHVIQAALKRRGFDRTFVCYDADVPLPATWGRKSRANGHIAVVSDPCIEAFLLELLGHPCGGDTGACKRAFRKFFPGNSHADPKAHAEKFPKTLLDAAHHPLLDTLLSAFTLPRPSTDH